MGLLTTIQQAVADRLVADAFFSADPAIPVFTEQAKSSIQAIDDAESGSVPLSVSVMAATAAGALNQIRFGPSGRGKLHFETIRVLVNCFENPDMAAPLGLTAADLAEKAAWLLAGFAAADNAPLMFEAISILPSKTLRAYQAVFTVSAGTETEPQRI